MALDRRPPRLLDTLSPSERKNSELFQMAGSGRSAIGMGHDSRLHGRICSACAHWEICRVELGEGQGKMNYCARPSRGFLEGGKRGTNNSP